MIERIYLGDRAVKGIEIDSWDLIVRIKIDFISRLKVGTHNLGLYPQLPPTIGYVAGMASDSSGRNFPKGAPLPSDIQTFNPGVRNE